MIDYLYLLVLVFNCLLTLTAVVGCFVGCFERVVYRFVLLLLISSWVLMITITFVNRLSPENTYQVLICSGMLVCLTLFLLSFWTIHESCKIYFTSILPFLSGDNEQCVKSKIDILPKLKRIYTSKYRDVAFLSSPDHLEVILKAHYHKKDWEALLNAFVDNLNAAVVVNAYYEYSDEFSVLVSFGTNRESEEQLVERLADSYIVSNMLIDLDVGVSSVMKEFEVLSGEYVSLLHSRINSHMYRSKLAEQYIRLVEFVEMDC
ncbi:hypothetical protein [Vibrio barjaei]|uniref:hypothetical protein n=1 Tax=Vibrio barjaei TaxID=1676683 RepID=UPI00228368E4|nr:hypothetical protein [Vibrio barjaei]MCY9872334.1 hypothetical protein [Vibrio barjaei]